MTACDPEKEKVLFEMEDKPRMLLTYEDLLLEGQLLREKLKIVNKNLDRMVKKTTLTKEIESQKKQKHTTLRALIQARGGGIAEDEEIDEVTKEFYFLDN